MKLDHLVGRQVTEVQSVEEEDQTTHTITFEGGETVSSTDAGVEVPSDIQGTNLLSAVEDDTGATMKFGSSVAGGDPNVVAEILFTEYETMQGGEEEFPATADEAAAHMGEDPSPERVVDGPETAVEGQEAPEGGVATP